jgi:type II secretory pathway component PulF
MPVYLYEALDTSGNIVKDNGDFIDLNDLYQFLRQNNLTLVKYKKTLFSSPARRLSGIKRIVLAEVLKNISLLLKGGVPLRQALEDIQKSHTTPTVKWLLGELCKSLDKGNLLSDAIKVHEKYFSNIIITLIIIGEETGNLDKTLEDASKHLERIEEIVSSTKSAMLYPSFVFFAMIGALAFWMLYVLPKILDLITAMGLKEIPLATKILIKSVDIFQKGWPYFLAFIVGLVVFYIVTSKKEDYKYYWDVLFTKLPFIGTILRSSQLAFFFEYSSLLTRSGINIIRTFDLMGESIKYQILKRGILKIKTNVMSGSSLYDSFKKIPFFEPFILRMISVGEQTGNLPGQFSILAEYYMKQVDKLVSTISKVIEPLLLAFAGIIFMVIALGLLGPIYEIMTKIQ